MANPPFGAAMFARVPLSFAFSLDAGDVRQQVQGAVCAAIGDVHLQHPFAMTERAEVGHGPVQADKSHQALDEPCGLPGRHAEQNLYCQAGLDHGRCSHAVGRACRSDSLPGPWRDRTRSNGEPRGLSTSLWAGQFLVL